MAAFVTDYSQSGEQEILLRWAGQRAPGRLLDIGAADGVTFSNSKALIDLGWSAVLVEPAPWAADRLLALYREHPEVTVVNALVLAEQWGLVELHHSRDDLVSTTHAAQRNLWASYVDFESCYVMAGSLATLLDKFGPFDFASIDAEGETAALAEAYQRHTHWNALQCICAEVEEPWSKQWANKLIGAGWRQLGVTTNNVLLAR